MAKTVFRPAWGRNIQIGAYYGIGKGQFLSGNAVTGGYVMKKQSLNSFSVNSFPILQKTERFKALGISEDEALNISMDFIAVDGYGKYLKQPFTPGKYVEHVVVMEMKTTMEEISSDGEALRDRISLANVPPGATHIVTGIEQGAKVCLVMTHSTENIPDKENLNRKLEEISKELASTLQKALDEDKETVDCSKIEALLGETLRPELKLFSDINSLNFKGCTIKKAIEEMRRVHKNVLGENGSLGRPLNNILTGINEFSTAFHVNAGDVEESQEIPKKLAEKLLMATDQLTILEGRIEELRSSSMLPPDVQEKVKVYLEKCDEDRNKFRTSVEENLPKTRFGDEDAKYELSEASLILKNSFMSEGKLQEFLESHPSVERAAWLSSLLKSLHIPLCTMGNIKEAINSSKNQIFVLFFSISDVPNEVNWKRIVETFVAAGLQKNVGLFVVEKCENAKPNTIAVWKDKKQITDDYFSEMERLRAMNMAFPQSKFNPNRPHFTTTVYGEFPCPGKDCRGGKSLDWTCSKCISVLQFDCKGNFVCDCGSLAADQFLFKCSGESHGEEKSATTEEMKSCLSKLKPYPQKNILIIGETGVGKTTFINSTACYTMFSSMEETEKNELPCLIPFQFKTRINGVKHAIKIGDSENEVYKESQSVTQFPDSHYFKTRDTIFCLIDTPGIGDSRGVDKDKENIQNILKFLENFNEIHLICFVMEPNKCRLTDTFQYCFKELIMQFHRSILNNLKINSRRNG